MPGKTGEVEKELKKLRDMVGGIAGSSPRILHTHFASNGAPDVVFEQVVKDLASLENQIDKLTDHAEFQAWTKRVSDLLLSSPKREIYLIVD